MSKDTKKDIRNIYWEKPTYQIILQSYTVDRKIFPKTYTFGWAYYWLEGKAPYKNIYYLLDKEQLKHIVETKKSLQFYFDKWFFSKPGNLSYKLVQALCRFPDDGKEEFYDLLKQLLIDFAPDELSIFERKVKEWKLLK